MKTKIPLLVLLMLSGLTLHAQNSVITIGKGLGDGISRFETTRFRTSGQAGQTFLKTLTRNLELSGYFRSAAPSQASLNLIGSATQSGNQLSVTVKMQAGNALRYGKQFNVDAKQARTLAQQEADAILMELKGKKGFASTRLVLVGVRSGVKGKEIYLVDPDGGDLMQMTKDGSVVLAPQWTPDGSGMTYTSYHRGFPDVYEVNLRTGSRTVRARYSGLNTGGAISPDGKSMALILSREGKPELYVKNLATKKLLRLTNTPMAPKSSPSWSPDGSKIVFVSGHSGRPHLYLVSNRGGDMRRLTKSGAENLSPDWGGNGWIAYTQKVGRNYVVSMIHPQTGESRMLSPANANYEDPSWAPNETHLVCSRTISYQSSLVLLDTKGTAPVALLERGGDWYMPDWSPK